MCVDMCAYSCVSHSAFMHCEISNGCNSMLESFTHQDPNTFGILTLLVLLSHPVSLSLSIYFFFYLSFSIARLFDQ